MKTAPASCNNLKAASSVPAHKTQLEAVKLRKVSENLGALVEEHSLAAKAMMIMARTIRHSATLRDVLVALRLGPEPGLEGPTQ